MKKIAIIVIITALFGHNLFSQNFAPTGATWHYSYDWYLPAITQGYYKITSIGDTIINNKNCKKLKRENIGYNYMEQAYYNYMEGIEFIYSDSNKVQWYHNNQFYTLYDFKAIAGDYWYTPGYNFSNDVGKIIVDSIGKTVINSDTLKVIYQHTDSGYVSLADYPIIEKIGCTSFLFPIYTGLTGPQFPGPIRCYSDNQFGSYQFSGVSACDYILSNEFIADNNAMLDVYPIPSNEKIYITINVTSNDAFRIEIVDISGRILKTKILYSNIVNEVHIEDLDNGIYVCKIYQNQAIKSISKIMKN